MSGAAHTSEQTLRKRPPSTPAGKLRAGDRVMWGGRPATITGTAVITPTKVRLTNDHGEELDVDARGPLIRLAAPRLRIA